MVNGDERAQMLISGQLGDRKWKEEPGTRYVLPKHTPSDLLPLIRLHLLLSITSQ